MAVTMPRVAGGGAAPLPSMSYRQKAVKMGSIGMPVFFATA